MTITILERDPGRSVRLWPHRWGQQGYIVEFCDSDGSRTKLVLTEAQYKAWFGWLHPSFRWQAAA